MSTFVEPLVTQHLWYWLESERNWLVRSEVETGNGRIDLACKTPEGEYVGIELKSGSGLGTKLPEQVQRYAESGKFDKVYFASPSVKMARERVEASEPVPFTEVIRSVAKKLRAGISNGKYSLSRAISYVESNVPGQILSQDISYRDQEIRKHLREVAEPPGHDYNPSHEPIELTEAALKISRSVLPSSLGLIEIPLQLNNDTLLSPEDALVPGGIESVRFVHKAGHLKRDAAPSLPDGEEPWVRHYIWRELGGLPEGSIPNVTESEQEDRPIDVVAFKGGVDPAGIYQGSGTGDVIGVEVKGKSSYSPERVSSQLNEYLETGVFSKVYLGVPNKLKGRARELIDGNDRFAEEVGIIQTGGDGEVEILKDAPPLNLRFDGYKRSGETLKTGYGDVQVEGGQAVSSPFILSEWREPLTGPEGDLVVWNFDPRESKSAVHDAEELPETGHKRIDGQIKPPKRKVQPARAYLLRGYSADPFAEGQSEQREPRQGYVRLTVTCFDVDENTPGLDLKFGGGKWEGGYASLVGDQVEHFVAALSSLEHIPRTEIPCQGKCLDLRSFPFSYQDNRGHEVDRDVKKPMDLIVGRSDARGTGALLQLGERRTLGTEVIMTEVQRIDLLRTIRVARHGRPSEIPGESGYQRIGPGGADTWDKGRNKDAVHNPSCLEKLDFSGAK